ncbi:MAG: BtpA/SgcQ family protein [Cyanobacteria bacterium SID2]|nr:BtpA/SgcQ family protein [Cyanobacteria bacterium SID2]MBP0002540.1 BtpA/SgcQ family protein [Cyanobacteria bacterium SBC]
MDFEQIFKTPNPIIGVVHLLPLPSSPRWGGSLKAAIERAEREAVALAAGGVDGILVENFFDAPFTNAQVDPAVVSAMTVIIERLMGLVTVPMGINVLRNDARSSLAIATCVGAKFIRVNVLTGVTVTDQGIIEGQAHHLMRYRRELGSDVKIFADVLVKHGHPLGNPNLTLTVRETLERGLADGAILSGMATGTPPSIEDLDLAKRAAGDKPIFIGSGATWENIPQLMQVADGVIVSSSLKRHGNIEEPIDPIRVGQFVEAAHQSFSSNTSVPPSPSLKKVPS